MIHREPSVKAKLVSFCPNSKLFIKKSLDSIEIGYYYNLVISKWGGFNWKDTVLFLN